MTQGDPLAMAMYALELVPWLLNLAILMSYALSEVGLTQPHAAYSALTHGLLGRWTFCQELCLE